MQIEKAGSVCQYPPKFCIDQPNPTSHTFLMVMKLIYKFAIFQKMGSAKSIACVYEAKQISMSSQTFYEGRTILVHPEKIRKTLLGSSTESSSGKVLSPKQQELMDFLEKAMQDKVNKKESTKIPYLLSGFEVFLHTLEGRSIQTTDEQVNDAVCNYARLYGCEAFFNCPEEKLPSWIVELKEDSDEQDCSMSGFIHSPLFVPEEKKQVEEDDKDPHIQQYLKERRFSAIVFPHYRINMNRVVARLALKQPSLADKILSLPGEKLEGGSGIPCEVTFNGVELTFKQLKYGASTVMDWKQLQWPE